MAQTHNQPEIFELYPIGLVRRTETDIYLDVSEGFRPALKHLDQFSHVMVFWWADMFDSKEGRNMLQSNPPYAESQTTGVFATRAPCRPNPIAMTTCKLLEVDPESGSIRIENIDAWDGTRIVDLKAYFPVCDRVKEAHIPSWLSDWPEWMPDEGIGLEEGE